ncbi:unnamed protein product [Mycena citricolor]|uniref:F-box domain-containing protein n=1 Tax=Mycena citricolor TaxID=2018698 RepID=A0AAD2HGW0_9AGAR|nr:unnamed protein product [Mycena citricolor]
MSRGISRSIPLELFTRTARALTLELPALPVERCIRTFEFPRVNLIMTLLSLPSEILTTVFLSLDARSATRLSEVSRKCFQVLRSSSAVQYQILLELSDMHDSPCPSPVGSAARLELLKAREAAWATIQCDSQTTMQIQMGDRFWDMIGNVIATCKDSTFTFTRLPSPSRGIPQLHWSTDLPPDIDHPGDFTMDFSQDLLVVIQEKEPVGPCLLSMKTGLPHPMAQSSRLTPSIIFNDAPSYQIRIFGDYVAVLWEFFGSASNRLSVWNWKSGALMKCLCRDDITSYAFLNESMLLVSILAGQVGTCQLYSELWVVKLDGPIEVMVPCLRLGLPHLSRRFKDPALVDLLINTEPSPSWPSDTTFEAPFTTSHLDRLFVLSLARSDGYGPAYLLCIRLSVIFDILSFRAGDQMIRWEDWGPPQTRMVKVVQQPDPWVCFVYGQRCALLYGDKCQILDLASQSRLPKRITHETGVDERCRFFSQPVVTSGPFSLLSVSIPPSAAVMLAEDGLITVSVSPIPTCAMEYPSEASPTKRMFFWSTLCDILHASMRMLDKWKSSMILQYCQNEFVESYYPTIESTFAKTVNFKGADYDCEILDTAGQDEFSILNSKHAIGIHGYVLVYSVTSRTSFEMIQIVYDKIIDFCGVTNIPCVIVGSKVDLGASRQVNADEGQKLAKANEAAWVETSAKSNLNIGAVFELCLSEIEKRSPNSAEPPVNRCLIM